MTYHILFATIRTIRDYVLFDFCRHLFRPRRHSTQERGLLRSFLVREACTRHQTEAVWWRENKMTEQNIIYDFLPKKNVLSIFDANERKRN